MSDAPTAVADAEEITAYEFPSLKILKEAHLKLLAREGEETLGDDADGMFLDDVRDFMERAAATGRVLDDERDRDVAQTLLNYWATVLVRAGVAEDSVPRSSLAEFVETAGRELDESQCPYCGLEAYSEQTKHLFFGREKVLARWLKILGEKQILVVLAPSGAGKTSLIRAGLLPAIRAGKISGSENWQIHETTLEDVEGAIRAGAVAHDSR